jgi:glucosylceramidase
MGKFDRRDFLKISAVTAAAAAIPEAVNAAAMAAPKGEIAVWTTTADQRFDKQSPTGWTAQSAKSNIININPAHQFQQILGFGAAFTDAACFTLNRLDPADRKLLFEELFSPAQMNLSVSRVCIGASDYSTKAYSYCDGPEPDPELTRFSIDHDRQYILPILREVRAVNPDMWLLASPWSPPPWMKFNNSMLGGCMRRKWLGVYARYFERFLAAYADAGVKINSVTPQNEVDTDQDGKMPACAWPQEYEIEFVRDHLGPAMEKSANPADIWILDHNYNLWGRVLCELEDTAARKHIKGIAWHGYAGTPDAMSRVQKAYPSVDSFWTEGGPDFEKPGYETEWAKWGSQYTEILRNWARCIIGWNYALDEKGKPNIGPFQCAGVVTIDASTRKITRGGQYWATRHFSTHMQRGARIVESTGTIPDITHVVARNPKGSFAAVVTNSGNRPVKVNLVAGTSSAAITLAADSVSTLVWNQ